jgi:hypothetical protein
MPLGCWSVLRGKLTERVANVFLKNKKFLALYSCLLLAQTNPRMMIAQTAATTTKQTTGGDVPEKSEIDHMNQLVEKLKLDSAKIKDPAAKSAALDNLDLWQHLLDHIMRENQNANNVGGEHHHDDNPAPSELKQSPKPQ